MNRPLHLLCFCFFAIVAKAQQERLPADLRQHNLTTYNASLFNPAFSLDRNNPESVALWVRWQWQSIDSDPSTLFLNYTRKLDERSAAGAAFFQHNTGIFFNTGGSVNYAYKFDLNPRVSLSVGANLFGFTQKLADDRFQVDPNLPLPLDTDTNDFILQFAPGISLEVERLTLSLASENLVDYNFGAKEGNTAKEDKIFMSLLSYDFPVDLGSATNAFLRPSMYLRTIPGQSNQVGFYTLLNTDTYWGHAGYNNFYGFALGGGYTFFDRVMVGALAEFGTGASIVKESSFELMASYFLGTPGQRHKMVGHDLNQDVLNPLESIEQQQNQDEKGAEDESSDGAEPGETSSDEEPVEEASEGEEQESPSEEELLEAQQKEAKKQQREAEMLKKQKAKQQAKANKAVRDSIAKQEKEVAAALKKQQKEAEKAEARAAEEQADREEAAAKEAQQRKVEQEEREKAEMEKVAADKVAKEEAEGARAEKEAAEENAANAVREQRVREKTETFENERSKAEKQAAQKAADEAERQKAAQEKAQADAVKAEQQRKIDSVAEAKAAAREAEKAEQMESDEPATETDGQEADADVRLQAGEKYEEVKTEAGLLPGYYLIANVFGTKKYYDAFMNDLKAKGMQPKSFRRSTNGFNYVYLQRYKTIQQARTARDSQYGGKYSGAIWIFRVRGE